MLRTIRLAPRLLVSYQRPSIGGPLSFAHRQLATESPGVIEVQSDQEYEREVKAASDAGQLAVVDFTAKWCGPCKVMAPVYTQLASLHPGVRFLKADIDNEALEKTVMDNAISSVPTFVFIKGDQREHFTGADPQQLVNMLNEMK